MTTRYFGLSGGGISFLCNPAVGGVAKDAEEAVFAMLLIIVSLLTNEIG